jgi:tRNA (guanosine-2'-O-)-methyltransferase
MAGRRTEVKRLMRAQGKPPVQLAFLLQNVEDPVNVGAAFRLADAAKAEVVLSGISARPPHKLITKVGRAKDQKVRWRHIEDVEVAIATLADEGFRVVALEIADDAAPYPSVSYPDKTCLLVGHEDHGVTKKALARAHQTVFLPMYGKGASLNVHMALGIVAFHVLHHRSPSA